MKTYMPFLKMKQNEVGAVAALKADYRNLVTPFFDLPRPKEATEAQIKQRVEIARRQADLHLKDKEFYLDNFDIDDSIRIEGKNQYQWILEQFVEHAVLPVVALHREPRHNRAGISAARRKGGKIAIRLTYEDTESYRLTAPDLTKLIEEIRTAEIRIIDLVIDLRVFKDDPVALARQVKQFIEAAAGQSAFRKIVVTGSSIPASVSDLLRTKSTASIERREWSLRKLLLPSLNSLCREITVFGDYGVVSPDYTDVELDFSIVLNVAAPKAYYTYNGNYFLVRGGAFKTHPSGYGQYFSIAEVLVRQSFFRPVTYSVGERYIFDRSDLAATKAKKGGSPGSWLKATLISHMTFVVETLQVPV